ncbi:hypothetical protein GCM10009557_42580 [Virgisporangium ochraceum]|uniref:Luciferase-like domain-containing protein n=1 Tax=Virgisporangium ochraceum TaxID=65505 RepID=A0A8J4A5I7_9ACTN|nr:LLM class flavin-dependent oxidoreductase [Virgisporangium ochraceum]GIJ75288.1 hypothetical protein Voc01_102050 [Virgisporangium ochraceum]
MRLTGLGIWTAQFDFHPADVVRDAVQELEALGYDSLWIGENVGREPVSQSAILLVATRRITIATGVLNLWARDPLSTFAAQLPSPRRTPTASSSDSASATHGWSTTRDNYPTAGRYKPSVTT